MTRLAAEFSVVREGIDIPEVAEHLSQEAIIDDRAVGHTAGQRHYVAILKTECLDVGDGIVIVERNREHGPLYHLRAEHAPGAFARTNIVIIALVRHPR